MMYLSQLLNKPIYSDGKTFGKIADMAIFENRPNPPVSKLEIRVGKKKVTIPPQAVAIKNNRLTLKSGQIPRMPYDDKDFYLAGDLLDKQVIDTDGKRLVRVNDVLLEDEEGKLMVVGIDVGTAGILRRLGMHTSMPSKILPWRFIEAFDYETGSIRIKLTEHSLKTLHPADIADILEEAGTKERIGIVTALDAKKAARAIEESDNETQASILEELPSSPFKEIVNRMHSSEIADVLHFLNPLKKKEIQRVLNKEKAQKVRQALAYKNDVAGGIMRLSFMALGGNMTVKETMKILTQRSSVPETIIITGANEKLIGSIHTKDLIATDHLAMLKDIVSERKFVHADVEFARIMKLFSQYNLRVLPVVDNARKPMGIIIIDDLLRLVEEEEDGYEIH